MTNPAVGDEHVAPTIEDVVRMYRGVLINMCRERIKDYSEVEDAMQEIFMRLWVKRKLYDPARGAYFSWMCTVARNTIADLQCFSARHYARRVPNTDDDGLCRSYESPYPAPHPIERLINDQRDEKLRRQVAAIPVVKWRKCVEMLNLQGIPSVDVGKRLGISHLAVKIAAHRGKASLRHTLTAQGESYDEY